MPQINHGPVKLTQMALHAFYRIPYGSVGFYVGFVADKNLVERLTVLFGVTTPFWYSSTYYLYDGSTSLS